VLPALSINSLALSPANPNQVFAGTGSTSAFAGVGTAFGVVRSDDGGQTWSVLAGETFTGHAINSIVPTTLSGGKIVLAATVDNGVWRSADSGATFSQISGTGGLPSGGVSSLVSDPTNPNVFYAALPALVSQPIPPTPDQPDYAALRRYAGPAPKSASAAAGVYRSDDGGVTWKPTALVLTSHSELASSSRILLSVGKNTGVSYAMVIVRGTNSEGSPGDVLQAVFRSADRGNTWQTMGSPSPPILPGGQGEIHGAVIADPDDANVVFITGDRQEGPPWPNPNGCTTYSGPVFRGDATVLPQGLYPWAPAVCAGASGTAPHADSRTMVFDNRGDLLEGDDAGIVKLTFPNTSARVWSYIGGNIRPTEMHSVAYDPLSKVLIGGSQDVGTAYQTAPGSFTWVQLLGGDGAVAAVDDDQSAHPNVTIRYSSAQYLGGFNRTQWDAKNNLLGFANVKLNIKSGPGEGQTLLQFNLGDIQFYQPYALNTIQPSRMLIGTATMIYESTDMGDSLNFLINTGCVPKSTKLGCLASLAYGGKRSGEANPDVFYVGTGSTIWHRAMAGNQPSLLPAYMGGEVQSLAIDPEDYTKVYVVDNNSTIWASLDEGNTWTKISGNLSSFSTKILAIQVPQSGHIVVAGQGGMFFTATGGSTWAPLAQGLPHALFWDLHYSSSDDVLVASSIGRGSWTLSGYFTGAPPAAPAVSTSEVKPTAVKAVSLPVPQPPPVMTPPRR